MRSARRSPPPRPGPVPCYCRDQRFQPETLPHTAPILVPTIEVIVRFSWWIARSTPMWTMPFPPPPPSASLTCVLFSPGITRSDDKSPALDSEASRHDLQNVVRCRSPMSAPANSDQTRAEPTLGSDGAVRVRPQAGRFTSAPPPSRIRVRSEVAGVAPARLAARTALATGAGWPAPTHASARRPAAISGRLKRNVTVSSTRVVMESAVDRQLLLAAADCRELERIRCGRA